MTLPSVSGFLGRGKTLIYGAIIDRRREDHMKYPVFVFVLAVCLVLSGCNLFSAEVTRPTQPPQPVQQAPQTQPTTQPTTAPTTEPATEPTTEPVEDLPELAIVGQWNMDSLYTTQQGVSIRDIYGTAIRNGEGMTFYGDGTFTYYAGACYGEGTYALDGDQIRVKLTKGDPQLDTPLVIEETDVLRIGMDQYGDGNLIWWTKTAQ